jgi:glycerol-3-phosphate acyltransferase PlsY
VSTIYNCLSLIAAYLLGSIPFGYLLVKYVFTPGQDVRRLGSGNIGATNVGRVAGVKGGVLTYVFDVAKGVGAVVLTGWISQQQVQWMGAAAILAIVGHLFPVWLGWRGGKGVATGVGVFLWLSPYSVISALVMWVVVVYWKRYVSLGSVVATASVPLWILLWEGRIFPRATNQLVVLLLVSIVAGVLIVAKHHENIKRLRQGTENKIGTRAAQPARSEA